MGSVLTKFLQYNWIMQVIEQCFIIYYPDSDIVSDIDLVIVASGVVLVAA